LLASTVPACEAYDPAFAYELSSIVRDGLHRMYPDGSAVDGEEVFYSLTIYNENYEQPARPDHVDDRDITGGIYKWDDGPEGPSMRATILFSGPANLAAREAQRMLAEHHDVSAELWSVTSYKRLRSDALDVERRNRLLPENEPEIPDITRKLALSEGPIVAVSDWMGLVPGQVSKWVPRPMQVLGTDGFGRSDTREALRGFFEVDAPNIVVAVLSSLAQDGVIDAADVSAAIRTYGIDPYRPDPAHPDTGS
jgi:pyruvate dehydrogenase E1 component